MKKVIKNYTTRCFINDTHVSIPLRKLGNLFLCHNPPSRVYIYHHFNKDLLQWSPIFWFGLKEGWKRNHLLKVPTKEHSCGTKQNKRGTESKQTDMSKNKVLLLADQTPKKARLSSLPHPASKHCTQQHLLSHPLRTEPPRRWLTAALSTFFALHSNFLHHHTLKRF